MWALEQKVLQISCFFVQYFFFCKLLYCFFLDLFIVSRRNRNRLSFNSTDYARMRNFMIMHVIPMYVVMYSDKYKNNMKLNFLEKSPKIKIVNIYLHC